MTEADRVDYRGRPLCEALTKRKTNCLSTAMPNSPFCEIHDPTGEGLRHQISRSRPARAAAAWAAQQRDSEGEDALTRKAGGQVKDEAAVAARVA